MSAKQLLLGDRAHLAVLRGVGELAKAVKVTLGPKGWNAMMDRQGGPPTITKDGVTVANEIVLAEAYENMGAQLVREAASKTGDTAGDGTTTAIVLADAMVREGVRHLAAGASAPEVKRGIDRAVEVVVAELAQLSRPCHTRDDILQVATISANQDRAIGQLIADAIDQVGTDGVVTVEESRSSATWLEVVEGLQFDRGYLSPSFVTDSQRMAVVLDQPALLILDRKLSALHDLLPFLEQLAKQGTPLLIVAADVEGDALALLALNKVRGTLQVAAVKAPGFGEHRTALLEDLALVTGGQAILAETGRTLASVTLADLGRATRITVDQGRTTVIGGRGDRRTIQARIHQIKAQLAQTMVEADRSRLKERLAKLAGVAVIHVGGATETELQEKKARIEDAVHATQAAIAEGIVPGGGVALFRCAPAVEALVLPRDEQIGVAIVRRALEAPLRQIAENAGHPGSVVVAQVAEQETMVGFDAVSETLVDMFAAGIIDPVKVTRSAFLHAASVAGLLLTADVMVTEAREEEVPGQEPDAVSA